jgi:hypothetical protein
MDRLYIVMNTLLQIMQDRDMKQVVLTRDSKEKTAFDISKLLPRGELAKLRKEGYLRRREDFTCVFNDAKKSKFIHAIFIHTEGSEVNKEDFRPVEELKLKDERVNDLIIIANKKPGHNVADALRMTMYYPKQLRPIYVLDHELAINQRRHAFAPEYTRIYGPAEQDKFREDENLNPRTLPLIPSDDRLLHIYRVPAGSIIVGRYPGHELEFEGFYRSVEKPHVPKKA